MTGKWKSLFTLFILAIGTATAETNVTYGNCNYLIVNESSTMQNYTFTKADTICRSLNGTLAMIKSSEIHDLLEKEFEKEQYKNLLTELWIGGTKKNSTWYWLDGSPIPTSGEAQKWVSTVGEYMILSVKNEQKNLTWKSLNGTRNLQGYICEIPVDDPCNVSNCSNAGVCTSVGCQPNCLCNPGYYGYSCEKANPCYSSPCINGGECNVTDSFPHYNCSCKPAYEGTRCQDLKFVIEGNCKFHFNNDNRTDFSTANSSCSLLGGSLVSIKTSETQDFLENKIKAMYGNVGSIAFWTSGVRKGGKWIWSDGSEIQRPSAFAKWGSGKPTTTASHNFLAISSGNTVGLMEKQTWSQLHWSNEDSSSEIGIICEALVVSTCSKSECKNGGTCVEIGCQKSCSCHPGYDGRSCENDLLTIRPLQSSFVINPGEMFTVAMNINSTDGPTVVTLKKTSDGTIQTTRNKVNGLVNITSVPLWEIKSFISFTIIAAPYFNPSLYSREAIVHVTVSQPKAPGNLEVTVCRMKVTISFSADISSMKLQHKISIIRSDNSQIIKSKEISTVSTGKITETFEGLQPLGNFKAQVTVCEDRCTMPSTTSKSFVTPAAIPDQVVQYLLVTKLYNQDTCHLHWAVVDDAVDEFKITIISQRLSDGQSDQETKTVSGTARDLDFHVKTDRSYYFKIQAITCAGLGVELGRIGDCVTKTDNVGSPETNTNGSLATTVLSAVFGILLLVSVAAHLVNFILKRKKETSTEKQPAAKKVAGPYQTTYFDETNGSQDQGGYEVPIQAGSSASGFDGDGAIQDTQQENPYQYENCGSSVLVHEGDVAIHDTQQKNSYQYENCQQLEIKKIAAKALTPKSKPPADMQTARANLKPALFPKPK